MRFAGYFPVVLCILEMVRYIPWNSKKKRKINKKYSPKSLALLSLAAPCSSLILTVWLPFTSIQIHLPNPALTPTLTHHHPPPLLSSPCTMWLRFRDGGSLAATAASAASLKPSAWLYPGRRRGLVCSKKELHQVWVLSSQLLSAFRCGLAADRWNDALVVPVSFTLAPR